MGKIKLFDNSSSNIKIYYFLFYLDFFSPNKNNYYSRLYGESDVFLSPE